MSNIPNWRGSRLWFSAVLITFGFLILTVLTGQTNAALTSGALPDKAASNTVLYKTTRISQGLNDEEANGHSYNPALSADGRYVAYASDASNLVEQDNNNFRDIFIYDREDETSVRASVNSLGVEGNGDSYNPTISANGQFVAFESMASNLDLISEDNNNARDIFVHDIVNKETTRISVSTGDVEGDKRSDFATISGDGRFVAFESMAGNLVDGDTNAARDIFVRDRKNGAEKTTRISVSSTGNQGNNSSFTPAISADGRFVAFASVASNLVPLDTNNGVDTFLHDLQTGATTRVSVHSDGSQSSPTQANPGEPAISSRGLSVAFAADSPNLVDNDNNNKMDIFVHSSTGKTLRVSVDQAGNDANDWSYSPAISAFGFGQYVAFESVATDLVEGDTNQLMDIFVRDLKLGVTTRTSVNSMGEQGDDISSNPAISADGRITAFESYASNLVDDDTKMCAAAQKQRNCKDIFVYEVVARPIVIDISITLYNNPTSGTARQPYENIVGYFADALYESSNGVRKLGFVTFYPSNANSDTSDIYWKEKGHPHTETIITSMGDTVVDIDRQVIMYDIFEKGFNGSDWNFLNGDTNHKHGGYTIGHEWGHYYFGLYDEYKAHEDACDPPKTCPFYNPLPDDVPVINSIMNNQHEAARSGDFNWLNFSVSKNDCRRTAQFRVYNACGWDTISRPVSFDPVDGDRKSLAPRPYYSDLVDVAPWIGRDSSIELPDPTARAELAFQWTTPVPSNSADDITNAQPYAVKLASILGQEISYPDPILLMAYVKEDAYMTGMGVEGSVRMPDGRTAPVEFTDDGQPPDAEKGDGLYSAILGYDVNGTYEIQVDFDNHAGTAALVSVAFLRSVGIDGNALPIPPPVPVKDDFTLSTTLEVEISEVLADDYGNKPESAQSIMSNNDRHAGKIDYAGDKDVFQFRTLSEGLTYIRVNNLALGMNPKLRVFGSDGSTKLFEAKLDSSYDKYLFIPLIGVSPETIIYAEVSDVSNTASGGLYEFSAGEKLSSDSYRYFTFFPFLSH